MDDHISRSCGCLVNDLLPCIGWQLVSPLAIHYTFLFHSIFTWICLAFRWLITIVLILALLLGLGLGSLSKSRNVTLAPLFSCVVIFTVYILARNICIFFHIYPEKDLWTSKYDIFQCDIKPYIFTFKTILELQLQLKTRYQYYIFFFSLMKIRDGRGSAMLISGASKNSEMKMIRDNNDLKQKKGCAAGRSNVGSSKTKCSITSDVSNSSVGKQILLNADREIGRAHV